MKVLVILFVVVFNSSCYESSLEPLKIDPCSILNDVETCRAIPLNQPGIEDYDRLLRPGDICLTPEDFGKAKKRYSEIMRLCGEKCF